MIDARQSLRKLALGLAHHSGLAALARPMTEGTGTILMLHRVTAVSDSGFNAALSVTPGFLEAVIFHMKADGYAFVSMDEAVERIRTGGGRFAAITADDGYRDNLTEALPVLAKLGVPITVYIAPGLVDGDTAPWWELLPRCVLAAAQLRLAGETIACSDAPEKRKAFARLHRHLATEVGEEAREALCRDLARQAGVDPEGPRRELLMTWDELHRFAGHPLVTLGAHTINHYNLRRLPAETALEEMTRSADILRQRLGADVRHFAYPYGHKAAAGPREAELAARAGFASAVTTRHGLLQRDHAHNLHALPRISLDGRFQSLANLRPMLSGLTTPLANKGRLLVTV